jgi:hypothetical protein
MPSPIGKDLDQGRGPLTPSPGPGGEGECMESQQKGDEEREERGLVRRQPPKRCR